MSVRVRVADPANGSDAAALALLRRAWTEEDAGGPIDDPGFDARLDEWFAAEAAHRRYFLVEDGSTPIGMASVVVMRRMPRPGRPPSEWGYVHQVFVVAEQRGSGVGGVLMDVVVEAARADGLTQLVLNPTPRSVGFYGRHGFEPASRLLQRDLT